MLEPAAVTALPPTRRGREMRRRLVDAAATAFAERGYQGARVADITGQAGTSLGNFYRHFADKNHILLAVLDPLLDELFDDAWPPRYATPCLGVDELVGRTTAFFETYCAHRHLYRVMREAVAAGPEAGFEQVWKDRRKRFTGRVAAWVATLEGVERLGCGSPELVAEALSAMLEHLAYVHIGLATHEPTPEALAELGQLTGALWARCLLR